MTKLLEIKQDTNYRNDVQDELDRTFSWHGYGFGGSAISLGFKIPFLLTASRCIITVDKYEVRLMEPNTALETGILAKRRMANWPTTQ